MRQTSFGQAVMHEQSRLQNFRIIRFGVAVPRNQRFLPSRAYDRFPYVPGDPEQRDERCREVYQIQVQGLVKRLQATKIRRVVIGISGVSTQVYPTRTLRGDFRGLPVHRAGSIALESRIR